MNASHDRPLPGLIRWVRPLLAATVVLSGLVALVGLSLAAIHHTLMADPLRSSPAAVFAVEHRFRVLLTSLLVVYGVARITTLIWLWQVYRRLQDFGVRPRLRPWMAWASWVYPIGAVVVGDISRLTPRASGDAKPRPLNGLVTAWWVLGLTSVVLKVAAHGMDAGSQRDLLTATAYAALCGASVALLLVVRRVSALEPGASGSEPGASTRLPI